MVVAEVTFGSSQADFRTKSEAKDSPGAARRARAQKKLNETKQCPPFRFPMINLYSRDLPRALQFYSELGFAETFRTPPAGEPVHVELKLDGFTLGIATVEAAKEHHGLGPNGEGRGIEIVVWTADTDCATRALVAKGSALLSPPHDFLQGKLRAAWIADPDGNPIQFVQRKG